MKENMTPKQIVEYLDGYIIGQNDAKKAVAIALRNRYRRMKLDKEVQDEITPKNILMIGSTGVGKTEIARRMAKMMGLPFVKVEASKYTEVGFVGRDVESMVRDLVLASVNLVENEHRQRAQAQINDYIIEKITQKLLPPLPSGVSEAKKSEYDMSFTKMKQRVIKGEVDDLMIEIEISKKPISQFNDENMPPDMIKVQESIFKVLNVSQDKIKKEMSVKEAKEALAYEAIESVLDAESIRAEGLRRAQENGVIFIDEIDKVAVGSKDGSRQDPSKEGVQRDLLPIVEGSVVNTKYGQIKTDYILFIAAGAFHVSKVEDLIPEFQGRFPIRVELLSLTENDFYRILTEPKNALTLQYEELLKVDNIRLQFTDEALHQIASIAEKENETSENIGARRLHTILETVLEDISFNANGRHPLLDVKVDKEYVDNALKETTKKYDLKKYML